MVTSRLSSIVLVFSFVWPMGTRASQRVEMVKSRCVFGSESQQAELATNHKWLEIFLDVNIESLATLFHWIEI